jgi:hypothetical protein
VTERDDKCVLSQTDTDTHGCLVGTRTLTDALLAVIYPNAKARSGRDQPCLFWVQPPCPQQGEDLC